MSKFATLFLAATLAVAGLSAQKATAQENTDKGAKASATAKQSRWHGEIADINKKDSRLVVRKENWKKTVQYDSSTKWTQGKKSIDMSRFQVGDDVICLGSYDAEGTLHATRIDLRPR